MTPSQDGPVGESALGFRLIGGFKLVTGTLLAAAGFGIFRLMNSDLGASLEHLVTRIHLDPDNRLIHEAVSRVGGIDRTHLKAIGAGTFFYALLNLVEGTGLILLKPWAEYLTVIATSSLLPLEIYEVTQKVSALRIGVLVVNALVVVYLVYKLRQRYVQKSRSS
jgi:uncharacterized membrane protein (DUF2068 family)